MLTISAGMQKSGSAYFYTVINDLLTTSGSGVDARELKTRLNLDRLLQWHNNNIGALTPFKLYRLCTLASKHGNFVVKTHAGPNLLVRYLVRSGHLRIIYCYRDPRDVLLSSMDFGNVLLQQGESHTFARMTDFNKALKQVRAWLNTWNKFNTMPEVLSLRYEDMILEPVISCREIESFLNIRVTDEQRQAILWKYSRDNTDADRTGMHFNKAAVFRYKTEMNDEQRAACIDTFGKYLPAMGYALD